ncbi:hypothetical protein EYC80_005804 [Monilinia laxa]|uniref:Uncharacterized protein n=1 Tax=Monilinia laxa TaxID=61186 RepID=A0A5N6KFD7_MONLA|nr:hypothetical protein EYC80_005804 [Monilinia laxa]
MHLITNQRQRSAAQCNAMQLLYDTIASRLNLKTPTIPETCISGIHLNRFNREKEEKKDIPCTKCHPKRLKF